MIQGFSSGDPAGIRTPDTLLKRQVLCRLSYWGGSVCSDAVAGAAGLEPANGGVKVRCVTTSPRPYVVLVRLTGSLPRKRESSLRSAPRPLWIASASLGCAPIFRGTRSPAPPVRLAPGKRGREAHGGKTDGIGMFPNPVVCGVGKGTRTLDTRNHNPVL